MTAASVAAVIVTFHTGPALWPAIASVLAAAAIDRLIVVDNGNDRATLDRLRRLAAEDRRVTLLTGHGNPGFAGGCNLGAAQAEAPLLFFLNPDCVLPAAALDALLATLAADSAAWAAAPLLIDSAGHPAAGTPRRLLTPATMLGEALRLDLLLPGRFPRLNRHREPLPLHPFAVEACSGACLLIRRARFEALGGFDPGYFLHVEDLDFCRRLAQAGGRLLCVPAARVPHLGGTSRASAWTVEMHKARGFARYLRRYCRDDLSAPLLWLLIGAVWIRSGLRALAAGLRRRSA